MGLYTACIDKGDLSLIRLESFLSMPHKPPDGPYRIARLSKHYHIPLVECILAIANNHLLVL